MSAWEELVDEETENLLNCDDENAAIDDEIVDDIAYDEDLDMWQRAPPRRILEDYDEVNEIWRPKERVLYAPERGPPIFDFLFVFAAFVAALVLAYYTIT